MTDDTYPIETRVPARDPPAPLNVPKTRESIKKLKVGQGFTIPVAELRLADGTFRTTGVGARIHRIAKDLGVRVSTAKLVEGLRVRREQ